MAQSLILARLLLGWEDVGAARDYLGDMGAALSPAPGFLGAGGWKGVSDPQAQLLLFLYESPEAAGRGLAAIEDVPTMIERQSLGATPADVRVLVVSHADGTLSGRLDGSALLSLSIRRAEHGYGPELLNDYSELLNDYEDVFGGLALMSGYLGSLVGVSVKDDDELAGFGRLARRGGVHGLSSRRSSVRGRVLRAFRRRLTRPERSRTTKLRQAEQKTETEDDGEHQRGWDANGHSMAFPR